MSERSRSRPVSGLARLAFGSVPRPRGAAASRLTSHLAFLPLESLELDLSDPAQRALGDFELLEVLGEGGMGVVYRARQHSLEREVALKLLSAGPWASEEFVAGFRREAQNAALLQHPNIVSVYAIGEHDGLIYYTMELMQGQSLAQRLQRGPMPPREAATLLRTVAEAVDYAHRLGVLHLDLKPGNVLMELGGTPKVSDFGLARRLGQALSLENEQVSGTPSYMAPEQARVRSSKLTPATDVWGLGAILYEMLVGVPPFLAESPQETLRLVLEGQVRGINRRAAVPRDLEAICLHCLEKSPEHRYASARELADDLGRFLEGRAVTVRPLNAALRIARWAKREPRLATAAGITILAVLAGLAATTQQWRRAEHNAALARTQLWSQRGSQAWLAINTGNATDALQPLTRNLVEQEDSGASGEAAATRLRIGSLLAQTPALIQVIAVGNPVFTVAMANDGRWLAAGTEDGTVRLFDLPSGRERWRKDTSKATHFMMQATHLGHLWPASDGKHLLGARPYPDPLPFPSGLNQLLFDLDTGALWASSEPDFRDATFSPDGSHVLVRTEHLRTQLVRVADGRAVSPWREFDEGQPAWLLAPQGRHVAVGIDFTRDIELWDPLTLRTRFTFHFDEGQFLRSWAFTPDAGQLVLGHLDGQISLIDTVTGVLTRLQPQRPASVIQIRISDDGAWLAAAYGDGYALVWDLARRELLTRPIRMGDGSFNIDLDRRSRTMLARNELEAEVWRVPDTPGPALMLHKRPGLPATRYSRSNSWAPSVGLLATGTFTGEIRLWRTHQPSPLPWPPAPLPSDTAFDGRHVVAVDGAHAQVMDGITRRSAGPSIAYPQPVGFAFLAGHGDALVASAGRHLHVSDWRSGKARFPPIALGNSPNRLLGTRDGDVLIASQVIRVSGRGRTLITCYSLRDGHRLASTELDNPLHGMRLSGDGDSLLAWHFNELHVLDARTLKPLRAMQRLGADIVATRRALYADEGPVEVTDPVAFWGIGIMDADVDRNGGMVWALTSEPRLRGWRLSGGPPVYDVPVPGIGGVRLEAVSGQGATLLSYDKGLLRFTPSQGLGAAAFAGSVPVALLARSGDGRRLAISTRQGAMLYDAITGEWLTPPLHLLDAPGDPLHSLTLDPHGNALLVQTLWRRYVVPIPSESRPAAQLASLAPVWRPADQLDAAAPLSAGQAAPPDPRQDDPGAASMAPHPSPGAMLAAMPPVEPRFVDLRPHCNLLGESGDDIWPPTLHLRTIPRGLQRLVGHDFWIDCGIATGMGSLASEGGQPFRVDSIRVRVPRFAAVDVLLTGYGTTAGFAATPYAAVELHYHDGSTARLSIQGRRQVWPWWHDGTDLPEQPLAYLSQFAATSTESSWLSLSRFYAVRVHNPHPDRDVDSIAVSATRHAWSSPIVMAMTLDGAPETAAKVPGAAAPAGHRD